MSNHLIEGRNRLAARLPERRHRIDGRDWGVMRVGDVGPALVLIPGTLGRADIFWHQIEALGDEAQILSVSYPANGGIDDWASDLAALISAQFDGAAVVLGSSLGGYLAQYLAGHYPKVVKGLVAANTLASVNGIERLPPYSADLDAMPMADLREGFAAGLRGWLTPDNPYADLAGLLLAEVEGRIPGDELRARLKALKDAPPLPAQSLPAAAIHVVECDDDHLITPPMRSALRDTLRPGRVFRFRAASHFPYVTRPDAYTAMLREVLGLQAPGTTWPEGAEAVL